MDSNNIAVSWSEYDKSGCVVCGCSYCFSQGIQGGGCSPVVCGECEARFIILADGLVESRMGFGDPAIYPLLQDHPRRGIDKHEYVRPDVRPDAGEYWMPRGVGYDLSGFVKSKEAGKRIIEMFEKVLGKKPNTWLDYRPGEPNWIQVKVQVGDGIYLEALSELCRDGIITEDKIKASMVPVTVITKTSECV